ncbi:MAG: FAD-dependent monooxygenase, partial [Pseudomonadota bacterium]
MNEGTDVFISGGGIAGLAAAAGFAARGLTVTLVDPSKPDTKASDPGADLRSTAFLQPARSLLEANGVWDALAPHATPLETLQVIDTAGDPPEPLVTRAFQSSDISDEPFGWNIPNWLTRSVLTDVLTGAPNVDLRIGAGFDTILTRETEVRIRLTDGSKLKAGLAVAADGRASPLRTALGIDTKTVRYGQKALAFAVTHDEPHHNISTELYHQGGAFVLVPLPDHQGKPASS